jgi:hypothetical protein
MKEKLRLQLEKRHFQQKNNFRRKFRAFDLNSLAEEDMEITMLPITADMKTDLGEMRSIAGAGTTYAIHTIHTTVHTLYTLLYTHCTHTILIVHTLYSLYTHYTH